MSSLLRISLLLSLLIYVTGCDCKRNLFCGDEYFLSSQDDESTFLGSKMFKISPVTETFLKKWIREDDTMEAWLFLFAD